MLSIEPLVALKQLPPKFTLVFDDGEMQTTRRRTVVSSYFWEYHRKYPEIPLLVKHHIQSVIGLKSYNSDTHTKLCQAIEKDVYRLYEDRDKNIVANTSKIAFDTTIRMTNELMGDLAPYVAPFDLLDAIEINRHPKIQEAIARATPTGDSVRDVYAVAEEVIMNDPSLNRNGLARAYRNNTVKREQVLQTVTFRGIPTEPDGALYRVSINSGYLEGLTKIYDFVTDSRSATKASMSAEAPLQDSEYMARRLQFLASVVEKIEHKDCGSKNLLRWYIDPEVRDDDGTLISVGGIRAMEGKFVELDDNPGVLVELTGKEEHLNGTYVRMRSVLTCTNENPHTVCRTCFGGLYRNYYDHQNLGHLCCVTITEKITQNTLSTKHLVSTGQGARIQLSQMSKKFFKIGASKVDYVLLPHLKKFQTKITLSRTEAMNLADIMKMQDLDDLMVSHASYLTSVLINYRDKGITMSEEVDINQGNRKAFMSLPFIKYIKRVGFVVDKDNNFEIDLKDWNYEKPIFSIPQMEVSYSEHGQEVSAVIESSMANIEERQKPESPLNTLQELNTIVAEKLDIKLSILEVIIYATMVKSRNDPGLTRNYPNPVLGIARSILSARSLSVALSFQGHSDFMLNARSYFASNRVSSGMDVFFAVEEAVNEANKALKQTN